MAEYQVHMSDQASGALERLNPPTARRILKRIERLGIEADNMAHQSLTGQFAGYCRIRVGSYRVIYKMVRDRQAIVIRMIGHRKDVYDH